MRRRALVATLTAAGLAGALVPAALIDASTASSTTATPALTRTVVLPTGDAVRLGTVAGRAHVSVVAAQRSGVTGQFDTTTLAGDSYVFPAEARPFLGGVLDPSLFDATALAAAQQPGRTAVRLSTTKGATVDVPGLTVTSRTGTSASGYLSAAHAGEFRAALVRAWRAAVRPGAKAPRALFGGVTHLSAAGAAPQTVHPDFPQVTLIVKVLDDTGRPASGGLAALVNTDDGRKYNGAAFYQNGEARVSVPYGHYSAITDIGTFDESTGTFADRIVPLADFTVTQNLQTVTLDARTATVDPSVSVPRAAQTEAQTAEFDRMSRTVGSLGFSFAFGADDTYTVAPVAGVQVGSLEWLTGYTLTHDAGATPYSYDLSFVDHNTIPRVQHRVVQPFQLATIHARYYNDRPRDSQFVRAPIYPFQFAVFSFFAPLATPLQRTEYVSGDPTAIWTDSLIADPSDENFFGGYVSDDFRVYPYGSTQDADWLRGPLAPAPPEQTPGDTFYTCPACRTKGRLSVLLAPFTDTRPGHFGEVSDPADGPATTFSLSRGSTVLFSGTDYIGTRVSVPADDATYHLHLGVDRSADDTLTSTSTVTDLTFQSSATSGVPLPAGWSCGIAYDVGCTVLPLLKATLPLPETLSDRVPIGTSTFVMTIAPFAGGGTATITSAEVALKVGSGTYHAAALQKLANGRYRVTLDNPASAAGQAVTLRVTAADDAGDSITQTTRDAYLVASS